MSLDLLQASNSEAKGKGNKAGIVKINVDASFNSEAQDGATGVVIRHDKGKVIAIRNKWYNSLPNVITTEALACRDGVDLMLTLNLDKVIIEKDSQELVNLWCSRSKNRSCILPILYHIQTL